MGIETTRRTFLKSAAATGAALVIGLRPDGRIAVAATGSPAELNPFVRILPDGVVEVVIKHFEMGQGTTTGLATLVAEELDADWSRVTIDFAPADVARYKNLALGAQGTGGSTAIANSFLQYRKAGAAARDVLVNAAAETWNVPASTISIEKGVLKAADHQAHFGEMIAKAATLFAPEQPVLKSPDQFRLIGKDGLPRKDTPAKINGTATFALDVKVPGMVYVVILRTPRFGGKLKSFDASAAKAIKGFIDAKVLPTQEGVAVYAKNTWAAIKSREVITAQWDYSGAENRSNEELVAHHVSLLDKPQHQAVKGADLARTEAALKGADQIVEGDFIFPFLAHAPMEPLNCVIEPTQKGVRFHDGCQFPTVVQHVAGAILKIDPANVEIRTVYAGGSFGRRATPVADYHSQAAMAFALLGGKTPVKLVWTREDDLHGGFYRPMVAHRVRVGLKDGKIVGWDHRLAGKPILLGTAMASEEVTKSGIDPATVEGVNDTHYAIPELSVGVSSPETQIPVLWWRSVGHTHTAYAMESIIDMVAKAAKADPVEFRLAMLSGDDKDKQRLAGVLKLAAEKAGWGKAPAGRFQGVAVHKSFNTYVAEVVEISLKGGAVKVEKVTCAVDCGVPVNPDVIRAQMEGGIGYGLGAIMRNEITLSEGVVDQQNFPDYEPLRITDMPQVDVHIVASTEPPTGVGEPGVPPVGPALANAIHAATGTRVLRPPMTRAGVKFV
ncbi:MAG TPA: xanthine dehydrogenase family protein molybdopterin-binding subunit [Hyphomicrobiaceae bacterium]|nr:xanthine dehydrogenase family protein molybdopterin-binding subunit [Hyphomicrobiaceae bacterium]